MYQNTLQDLQQVFEDMERRLYASTETQPEVEEYNEDNAPLSYREAAARENLLQMCRDIVEMFGEEE